MAGEIAQFMVRLSTTFDDKGFKDAAKGVAGVETRIDALKGVLAGLGVTIGAGAIIKFGMDSLKAFAESERGVVKLAGAMKNLGSYSRAALDDQLDFARGLQATTAYSDEEIVATQTLLTTYGLYGDKLKQVTTAVLDLAARKGIDLHTATMMLGKAFDGETGRLKLLGIHFEDTGSKAKNFEGIMAAVNRISAGAAAEELTTYAGKVKNLGNAWDEVKESIGSMLVGPATGIINWLKDAVIVSGYLVETWKNLFPTDKIGQMENKLAGLNLQLKMAQDPAAGLGDKIIHWAKGDTAENITRIKNEIAVLTGQLRQLHAESAKRGEVAPTLVGREDLTDPEVTKRAKAKQELSDLLAQEDEKYRIKIEAAQFTARDIEGFEALSKANVLAMDGKFEAARSLLEKTAAARSMAVNVGRAQMAMAALSQFTALSNAKSKELQAVGKVAAVAMAMAAAFMSFASIAATPPWIAPFWITLPLAKLTLAAGLANAAMIAGLPLAKGGLIPGRSGGISATIGEAGTEAVLPLSDGSTMRRLAQAIMGAGGPMMALAGFGGGGGPIQVNQVLNFAGGATGGGSDVTGMIESIRIATRDGVAEALDLAKQMVRTGAELGNQA